MSKHIGIIAGAGNLPVLSAAEVENRGLPLTILAIQEEEIHPALKMNFPQSFFPVSVGGLSLALKILSERNVTHLLLIGKVRKELIFRPDVQMDTATTEMISGMQTRADDAFFFALLTQFEKLGIEILPQGEFLEGLMLDQGQYSGEPLSESQLEDVRFGMFHARKIGELDIGQTVVVHNRAVLAVEAIEGTDLCLQRAGAVTHKRGGIVCKTEKLHQDKRFDIPTVGLKTLEVMHANGLHTLAVEANRTFVVTPDEMIGKARELGITLYAGKVPEKL